MSITKGASASQRYRRKMREARFEREAAQAAHSLGGTSWQLVDFKLRPYAGLVERVDREEMKAVTAVIKLKGHPKHVSNRDADRYQYERRNKL